MSSHPGCTHMQRSTCKCHTRTRRADEYLTHQISQTAQPAAPHLQTAYPGHHPPAIGICALSNPPYITTSSSVVATAHPASAAPHRRVVQKACTILPPVFCDNSTGALPVILAPSQQYFPSCLLASFQGVSCDPFRLAWSVPKTARCIWDLLSKKLHPHRHATPPKTTANNPQHPCDPDQHYRTPTHQHDVDTV
jgi:hypothetical protein